jgi:hypothetical protein
VLTNADISARICEIRTGISNVVQAQIIWQAIADRNERLKVLQERWDYLRDALTFNSSAGSMYNSRFLLTNQ